MNCCVFLQVSWFRQSANSRETPFSLPSVVSILLFCSAVSTTLKSTPQIRIWYDVQLQSYVNIWLENFHFYICCDPRERGRAEIRKSITVLVKIFFWKSLKKFENFNRFFDIFVRISRQFFEYLCNFSHIYRESTISNRIFFSQFSFFSSFFWYNTNSGKFPKKSELIAKECSLSYSYF